jgi:hypothetical protein
VTLTQHSFRIRKIEIDAMQAYADLQDLPLAVVIRNALNLYAFAVDLAVNHQLAKIDVTGEIIERLELSPPPKWDVAHGSCLTLPHMCFRFQEETAAALRNLRKQRYPDSQFWVIPAIAWRLYRQAVELSDGQSLCVVDETGTVVTWVMIIN